MNRLALRWTPACTLIACLLALLDAPAVHSTARSQLADNHRVLLTPAEDSDEDLPDARLEVNNGRTRVELSIPTAPDGAVHRSYWTVDLATRTYRIFHLSDTDSEHDVQRIRRALRDKAPGEAELREVLNSDRRRGRSDLDRLRGRRDTWSLADSERPDENVLQVPDGSGHAPVPVCLDEEVRLCGGGGFVRTQVWEPAKFIFDVVEVAYVKADVSWTRDVWTGGYYVSATNPTCWANPQTFVFTTWFIGGCGPIEVYNAASFQVGLWGNFYNYDFGLDSTRADAAITAELRFSGGGTPYRHMQFDFTSNGYEHLLLAGVDSGYTWEDCPSCDPNPVEVHECEHRIDYHYWDYETCECVLGASPLLIDLDGDGLELTDAGHGVSFDLLNEGLQRQVAWTAHGANDAFVGLDRNGNGLIDDGTELFGNATQQAEPAPGEERNGFRALAIYDLRRSGGNGDGRITQADGIYEDLRLWIDRNHDGLSEPSELSRLADLGVRALSLNYAQIGLVDEFGNALRYRSRALVDDDPGDRRVRGERRFVYDVFFRYIS